MVTLISTIEIPLRLSTQLIRNVCFVTTHFSLCITSLQAKKFVEELPQNVKEKASKEEVEEIKKVLEAVGGTVEIEV